MKSKRDVVFFGVFFLIFSIFLISAEGNSLAWSSVPNDAILDYGQSLNVQFIATSSNPIVYSVNDTKFRIDNSGYLTNTSKLSSGSVQIKVYANDSINVISKVYKITVKNPRIDSGTIKMPVSSGWNEIAFSFLPSDKSVLNVFNSTRTILSQVKTQEADGSVYIWEAGIDDSWNDLRNIKFGSKYLVNVQESSAVVLFGYSNSESYFYENTSTAWVDVGSCILLNDSILRKREVLAKDYNKIAPDVTMLEEKIFQRDCCRPNWIEGAGICNGDTIFTAYYHDTNSCFEKTRLPSDNNPPEPNTYSCNHICSNQLGCDYTQCSDGIDNDGNGFIDYPEDSGCNSYRDESEIIWDNNFNVGLVSYHNFDEGTGTEARDLATGKNNGTSLSPQWIIGKNNNAINITDGSDVFNLPSNSQLGLAGSYTFAAWVNPYDCFGGEGYPLFFWSHVQSNPTYTGATLGLYSNTCKLGAVINRAGHWSSSINAIPLNQWTFVALTVSGETGTFYINGGANGTYAQENNGIGTDFKIGQGSDLNRNWFHGGIDEVAIWNRSLSAAEVNDLYNQGNGKFYKSFSPVQNSPSTDININNKGSDITQTSSSSTSGDSDSIIMLNPTSPYSSIANTNIIRLGVNSGKLKTSALQMFFTRIRTMFG
jgi:hypothetical protein